MPYYYLAAQLPCLDYRQAAPMSSHAFRELAETFLRADDAVWLDRCVIYSDAANASEKGLPDFFIHWYEWEQALRLNLARWRSARLKRDISFAAPDYPKDAVVAAKAASVMDSPFEAELFLDEARWQAIDSFQGFDCFNRNAIYAYFLKLQLLERRSRFMLDNGLTEYTDLYTTIMEAGGRSFI